MIMMKGMIYGYDFDDYHAYDEGDDYDEMMNMMNMTMIVNTYKFEGVTMMNTRFIAYFHSARHVWHFQMGNMLINHWV